MITGDELVDLLRRCGITHVVWIPDSDTGKWDAALSASPIPLFRPTREGEALALAGGLMLGGARPLVVIQCTGLFEAGDALRNLVHDLRLPLLLLVGVRNARSFRVGKSGDSCPRFIEPILNAWDLAYSWLPDPYGIQDLESALKRLGEGGRGGAVLLPE